VRYLAVAVVFGLAGLCLSPNQPLPQCYEEIYVISEVPAHVRCSVGATLDIDGPLVTCRCKDRGEVRLVRE